MLKWDAYIHTNGSLIVKRFFNNESFIEKDSPFVLYYIEPVEAEDYDTAYNMIVKKAEEFKNNKNYMRKSW